MTFYDFPWYWSDEEIYEYIRDVGKEYENTYARGGANITIFRNSHQYFFIMFDSLLM
ncbi:hypothetical protein GLOIN_2v1549202 [Rhizophagus irregularis DAOM 181602=DAOM 197198]|uniref:Uncharacterized protein n=1 Tax=Rhizophagus irregularis (strain DAOM 181602 / DAOM 197198 / MUCL 43194) TaxID=747089 RepID=A0A2P4QI20_RHIID|nr:hypothetical protein GLOIN_2v1549202 [Rhizophagus irregularis DAOM 181602=DAOM 197198]POG77274.1 hypothetical protein GLOIN_2v1549202 [Rhizophagus irregularis DAOM 181602=DAOM 197198]|eukprot:XP_025184140.1 hypothetical protein GLOIN_2v1549202 [Rhizophagus irregularis DAOM 181602=DAOM 197198]